MFLTISKIKSLFNLAIIFVFIVPCIAQRSPCIEEDYDCRIAAATKAIEFNSNDSAGYISRGNAYDDKGFFQQALKDYARAIELDPTSVLAYFNRGLAFYNNGDVDRAIADYTKVIEIDPKYTLAYYHRGNAYDDKGDFEKALDDYNKSIVLDSKNVLAYVNRGIAFYRQGKYLPAISDYTKAIKLTPDYAEIYARRAKAYDKTGEKDKAAIDIEQYEKLSGETFKADEASDKVQSSALKDTTESKYKVGQMWSYRTRPGEENSFFIIVKIENHPDFGNIIHVAVQNLKIKNPKSVSIISEVSHLPFSEAAINQSTVKVIKEKAELPNYREGYDLWRQAFDAKRAGIYNITLAEAIKVTEDTLNQ